MAKASDADLGDLHALVALVLGSKLKAPLYDSEGEPIPGTEYCGATAAEISVAVAFLKNNNITADPETNKGLEDLRKRLQENRANGKKALTKKAIDDAAAQFERDLGDMSGILQ